VPHHLTSSPYGLDLRSLSFEIPSPLQQHLFRWPVVFSRYEANMLQELQTWWQTWWSNITPETVALLQHAGVGLGALVGGYLLGSMVARFLRTHDLDAALGLSGPSPGAGRSPGFTPSFVCGMLVRATVWGAAISWLARQHGGVELPSTIGLIINRAWALVGVLIAALAVAGFVTRRLQECLQTFPVGSATSPTRNGAAGFSQGAAGAITAAVYGLVLLLSLLVIADLFDWPLTRTSAAVLWQFAQHLFIAVAALLIGVLGARWARDVVTAESALSPQKLAGQYTALGIVAVSTILAVSVLLTSAGLLFGLAAMAILGGGLWAVRRYLPDVAAGLLLRAHNVSEVEVEGAPWRVAQVGLIASEVRRAGAVDRLGNRKVLESRLQGSSDRASSPEPVAVGGR